MSMLRFTCVAAETQYSEILSVIFVFHSVFCGVREEYSPICCTREVSSAMLAPPAASITSETFLKFR